MLIKRVSGVGLLLTLGESDVPARGGVNPPAQRFPEAGLVNVPINAAFAGAYRA